MRNRFLLALCLLVAWPGLAAHAKTGLSKDEKIAQALNRLTFGPRPGDFQSVRKMGLKKWIDRQLHPQSIAENPQLEQKLKWLDSLSMSQKDMVLNYPPPQLVRQMVRGRLPLPADPARREAIERMAARIDGKPAPAQPKLADLLGPEQVRTFQQDTPQQKIELIRSLPAAQQEGVLEALGRGVRNQMYVVASSDLRRKIETINNPAQILPADLMEGKLLRAIYSSRQLEEVLTDFWFNHFNVFLDKGSDRYLTTAYERDAIRPHVLGKFADLLRATAESPAMLFYLDNWQSAGPSSGGRARFRRGLNENYGRELMELHTLGVDGGYTQHDVTEVARCFTGWTIRELNLGGQFYFDPRMHDQGEKMVLGVKIPAGGGQEDGRKVLDLLAHHPSTARFISRKLAQRFVADDPPPALVDRMAKTFLAKDGDLRAVMKTMLESREFWSRAAFRSKMKSPLEMVASSVRALDANVDFGFALVQQVAQLGEPLYRKQEPTGYSNRGQDWVNSASLLARMNFGMALAGNKIPGVKVNAERLGSDDPRKIARTLLLADLPAPAEKALANGLEESSKAGIPRTLLVAGLTIGSPEFQKR